MILKILSLSEKNLLIIKQEKQLSLAIQQSKNIRSCLNIKFSIFLIICCILLLFLWYFISCFCGIYINTQITLIKDTLISFGVSMINPFYINLIPGIFRISSLRAKKKDRKCMYKISEYLSLI